MSRIAAFFVALPVLLVAAPASVEDSTVDQAAIRALDREMVAALNARDVNRYMNALAEDATWMPPNQPAVVGSGAIRKLVSQLCEIPDYTVAHHPRTVEISSSGDLAYLFYTYAFTVKDADGTAITEKGKDLSIFRRVGGSWRLVIDMWNSDAPAADATR